MSENMWELYGINLSLGGSLYDDNIYVWINGMW